MNETIPIIHEGTPEGHKLTDPYMNANGLIPRTYIWVGKWKSQHEGGGSALGSQSYGILITGTLKGYPDVYRKFLVGGYRYEPDTVNKIGGKGAYRDLPPTQDVIDATITEAIAYLERQIEQGVDPWAYLNKEVTKYDR